MTRKLVIQIPTYNEEENIEDVLNGLPQSLKGVGSIETVLIDDGSTDRTVEKARNKGVEHIVRIFPNSGLGIAYRKGLEYCLSLGADIIVNTDGDDQYPGVCIQDIIDPILEGSADMVVGDRQLASIAGYPRYKLFFQTIGRWLVRLVYKGESLDVTSGLRAMSRECVLFLNKELNSKYTCSLESICLVLRRRMRIASVPIAINHPTLRSSRLIKNKACYVKNFLLIFFSCFLKNNNICDESIPGVD
jgi:glycosyltransferase involved in cell wall biosynthesis